MTWVCLATSMPTTPRVSPAAISLPPPVCAERVCVARHWPLDCGPLVHGRSFPARGRAWRSSSAIDRTDSRGRRGRLFRSVVSADGGPQDRHLPRATSGSTLLPIYKGGLGGLYTPPSPGSTVICRDELGPIAAPRYPGPSWSPNTHRPHFRPDYARHGYRWAFGALAQGTGAAFVET